MRLPSLLLLAGCAAACGPAAETSVADVVEIPFPGAEWPSGDPADHDLDPAALAAIGDYAASIGSHCLVVIRDGELVYEWYGEPGSEDEVHDSWSVAKSFTSALVGAAIEDGLVESAEQPAADFVVDWAADGRSEITLAHLLSGVSGLVTTKYPEEVSRFSYLWELSKDYGWSIVTHDQTASAIDSEQTYPAGAKWKYNNRAIQSLDAVLKQASGEDTEDYAWWRLWHPIGMSPETYWKRDVAGNVTTYSSVMASCRDLARFGYLVLHRGRWADRQILDADYVTEMTSPSQSENPAYGYLWWLNGQSPHRGNNNELYEEWMFGFMPADLVSAQGVGQNFVDIVPSTNTVFVHLRPAPHEKFRLDFWNTIGELLNDADRNEHRELWRRFADADGRAPP